jgi:hypothetical protein
VEGSVSSSAFANASSLVDDAGPWARSFLPRYMSRGDKANAAHVTDCRRFTEGYQVLLVFPNKLQRNIKLIERTVLPFYSDR